MEEKMKWISKFLALVLGINIVQESSSTSFGQPAEFDASFGKSFCDNQFQRCMDCSAENEARCETPVCTRGNQFKLRCETANLRCNSNCDRFEQVDVHVSVGYLKSDKVAMQQTQKTDEVSCTDEYLECMEQVCTGAYKTCAPCRAEVCDPESQDALVSTNILRIFDPQQNRALCAEEKRCSLEQFRGPKSLDITNFLEEALTSKLEDEGTIINVANLELAHDDVEATFPGGIDAFYNSNLLSECVNSNSLPTQITIANDCVYTGTGGDTRTQCGQSKDSCFFQTKSLGSVAVNTITSHPVCNECPHQCNYDEDFSDSKDILGIGAEPGMIVGTVTANCVFEDSTATECRQLRDQCIADNLTPPAYDPNRFDSSSS
mmetsp:Transcript_1307/g.1746  ORF Transcript_1307/g.1746 Transcript_1307/m.1746 type:complete len:376 (-) Transcript_1307:322-1449(-)